MTIDLESLRASVSGDQFAIEGPFGARPLVYVDFVASGRALPVVERAISSSILPYYGNTHTETSFTGRAMTGLVEDARKIIEQACGVDDNHRVVFAGNGATGAIDKLVRLLKRRHLHDGAKPIVFVGPYEHHSNDLLWRESGFLVRHIEMDERGGIDIDDLGSSLNQFAGHTHKYGVFSAASNVTGVMSDTSGIAKLLRRNGARFFCDFAAAAPYIDIRLRGFEADGSDRIDAAFISSHKFVGGVGGSGILIADNSLLEIPVPTVPGGGSVRYVTEEWQEYSSDLVRREEAGTPNIVGNIRAGYAFLLKQSIGCCQIERLERVQMQRFESAIGAVTGIEMLGNPKAKRLGIYSFNVAAAGRPFHYGFVVALLNDLFGIQARGGCSCAGPYGHRLLQLTDEYARRSAKLIGDGFSGMRAGWVRVGINYLLTNETTDYIADALKFVARRGLDLLNLYDFDVKAGVWRVRDAQTLGHQRPTLLDALCKTSVASVPPRFVDCLAVAEEIADKAKAAKVAFLPFEGELEALRWFWLPGEVDAQKHKIADQRVGR